MHPCAFQYLQAAPQYGLQWLQAQVRPEQYRGCVREVPLAPVRQVLWHLQRQMLYLVVGVRTKQRQLSA